MAYRPLGGRQLNQQCAEEWMEIDDWDDDRQDWILMDSDKLQQEAFDAKIVAFDPPRDENDIDVMDLRGEPDPFDLQYEMDIADDNIHSESARLVHESNEALINLLSDFQASEYYKLCDYWAQKRILDDCEGLIPFFRWTISAAFPFYQLVRELVVIIEAQEEKWSEQASLWREDRGIVCSHCTKSHRGCPRLDDNNDCDDFEYFEGKIQRTFSGDDEPPSPKIDWTILANQGTGGCGTCTKCGVTGITEGPMPCSIPDDVAVVRRDMSDIV